MTTSGSALPRRKVLIVDAHQENNAVLKTWFAAQPEYELLGVFLSPQLALKSQKTLSPDLALVGIDMPNGIKFCKILRKKNPALCIFALVSDLGPDNQGAIRQSGALESLVRGASPDLISQTIRSVTAIEGSTLCSIVGIGGIKEGVGTTFLTGILGDYLGRHLPGRVLLMDLDFRRGDLAFSLGQPSKKHILDLVAMENFLQPQNLQKFISATPRGFSLLPAAQDPGLKVLSDIGFVGLMTVLGNFFEVILIDLPPYPFPGLPGVVDICDTIILNVGDTPNQMKSLYCLVNGELKKLPESYAEKLLFVSWRQDSREKAEIEGITTQSAFLPRPGKMLYSDPACTINDSPEYEPLRTALGVLLGKIPGLSLYANLEATSGQDSSETGPLSRFARYLFGK